MALLTPDDLKNIKDALVSNDRLIEKLTGTDLKTMCSQIYGTAYHQEKIGIIPITAGGGIIGSFSESLLYTVSHFGMDGFITEKTDVAGFYEAVTKGADIILMADDLAFVAYNVRTGQIAHNQICTGIVYSEILIRTRPEIFKEAAAKAGKTENDLNKVLAIGIGKVGKHALRNLLDKGCDVYVYDADPAVLEKILSEYKGAKKYDPADPHAFLKIFEATPCADTIRDDMIIPGAVLSTPGIPIALSEEKRREFSVTAVQEPLGIGTMSMIYQILDKKE